MRTFEIEVRDDASLQRTGEEWEELERRLGSGTVVRSWAWTRTWLEHYGDLVDPRFVLLRRDGELQAIALLCAAHHHRRGPLRLRTLHLGTAGEPVADSVCTPYNGMLAAPGARSEAAAALLSVAQDDGRWDELRFDGLPLHQARLFTAADPTLTSEAEVARARDLTAVRAASGHVVQELPRKVRYALRRTRTGIGAVDGARARSRTEAQDVLEELVVLHSERWRRDGLPGAFASARFAAFHRSLLERLPLEALVLYRARTDRRTVGCLYGFIEEDAVLMYQGGFASFDDPRAKPGFVSHVLCMQTCLEDGLARYDLLAGDGAYKTDLTDVQGAQLSLRGRRRRARLVPVEAARRFRARVTT